MTSASLVHMLRAAVSERHPTIAVDNRDKTELLEAVAHEAGWRSVVDIGRCVLLLREQPVIRALLLAPSPAHLVERWTLLERYGHSRNYTVVTASESGFLELRHQARDGGGIAPVNDLFIWGLIGALIEGAGFHDATLSIVDPDGDREIALASSEATELPAATNTVRVRWTPAVRAAPAPDSDVPVGRTRERLNELIAADPVHSWTVAECAKRLGRSARTLQRELAASGTTFSKALQGARVAVAEDLLGDRRLSLSDVAFCAGFSDHAHFTRIFRRFADVPPSAFRDVLVKARRRAD